MKKKLQCQFNQVPVGTYFFKNGNSYIKKSTRTAHLRKYDKRFYFAQKEQIEVTAPELDWHRINCDGNGNGRHVVHFLQCEPMSWKNDGGIPDRYARVCKLMNKIGGRKFHNKQYGGGIVFQTSSPEYEEFYIARLLMSIDSDITY